MDFANIWVLIPIVAIVAGTFKEYMKMRAEQRQLGTSTDQLEKTVAELQSRERELLDRVQNLEAIVVSQTWDVLHDKGLVAPERERKLESVVRREVQEPDPATLARQQAEQLARRLR
jgi:hypothetical protein